MKFDKDIIVGIIICAAVLFGWDPLCKYMGWTSEPVPATPVQTAPAVEKTAPATPVAAAPEKKAAAVKTTVKLPAVILANKDLSYKISPVTGSVDSITLADYKNAAQTGPVVLEKISPNARGAFSLSGSMSWELENILFSRKNGNKYVLSRRMKDATGQIFIVTQTWELAEKGYAAKYTVNFANPGKNTVNIADTVLCGGELPPWGIVSGDKVRIPSHRMDYMTAEGAFGDIKADKKDSKFFLTPAPAVKWVALDNKYFAAILQSKTPFILNQRREYLNDGKDNYPVIASGAWLGSIRLAPGESKSFDFNYYSGPKIIADLDAFDPSTGKVMHLAWGPLDYLARLLLWLLIKFNALLGSYGWSIILLTLVVRLVFYPLTARGNASMKKMQLVQPKLKEIREKYKDNPQLMNSKMMELYRTEGVNPFGGCLPILLQIPVFFALYATLDGAVELRQVSFFWCKDLAAADTVARLPLYFFNLPINPLVLAMTALMVLQQHMTPMSMDPVQKKMMALMPIVMLFMLYDLPSGLTLYWTVSNLFSIIQLKLQQRSRSKENQSTPVKG
ncbi:MAG: membrane protein insertase YidC [Lentisphaerae bacterium]|nr:membrane protein insertase YidC [Lentisphaerota bacterium]